MNNLKIKKPSTGLIGIYKLRQKRNINTHPHHGEFWHSAGQVKNRFSARGYIFPGVRQS